MRLIDVDKLKEYLQNRLKEVEEKFAYEESKKIARHTTKLLCDDVDAQETVEAIPVEWIEAEIKYLKALDFEFASLAAGQIEAMLKKWREEQKAPHCGPDYCDINFGGGAKA